LQEWQPCLWPWLCSPLTGAAGHTAGMCTWVPRVPQPEPAGQSQLIMYMYVYVYVKTSMQCASGTNCMHQYAVWLVQTERSYMHGHDLPVISAWVNAFACLLTAFVTWKREETDEKPSIILVCPAFATCNTSTRMKSASSS